MARSGLTTCKRRGALCGFSRALGRLVGDIGAFNSDDWRRQKVEPYVVSWLGGHAPPSRACRPLKGSCGGRQAECATLLGVTTAGREPGAAPAVAHQRL